MAKKYVSNQDESVRIFKSDFLERFTHVHPAVPHILFVPVMVYMLYLGYQRGVEPIGMVALFVVGILAWSLAEYLIHRFLFHLGPELMDATHRAVREVGPNEPVLPALKSWKQVFYFLAHGVHHDFPSDSRRLVMPPGVSIPLAFLFYYAFKALLGGTYAPVLFGGFVLGYLMYDSVHYATHHFSPRTPLGRYLKKRHYRHHYNDSDSDYGVSSPLWDVVFGTLSRSEGPKPS